MNFQRNLAITPTSLHTIAVIVMVLWIVVGVFGGSSNPYNTGNYKIVASGWWFQLPSILSHAGWFNSLFGMLASVFTVYTLAELNISQVLLRVNSRIMSIVFGALVSTCIFIHSFCPGMVMMVCVLLSYFGLFSSYQLENSSTRIYSTFLYLSIASLTFPKALWLLPIYWPSMYMLRTCNIRSVIASVLGLLTPYWIVGTIAFCTDKMPSFWNTFGQFYRFHWGGYTTLSTATWVMIGLTFIMFMIGVCDFFVRIYMDKNRTRNIYYVIILHGFAYFLLLILQPIHAQAIMPLILLSTSIMAGHYIANGESSLSNILTSIISATILIVFVLNTWIL